MSDEETRRSVELKDYFSVLPAYRGIYRDIHYKYDQTVSESVDNPYNSSCEKKMSREDLKKYLLEKGLLLDEEGGEPLQRYWPGDKENTTADITEVDATNV